MESYVLHIYRRQKPPVEQTARRVTDRCQLVGVLEMTASERRIPFHSAEELWGLLVKQLGDNTTKEF